MQVVWQACLHSSDIPSCPAVRLLIVYALVIVQNIERLRPLDM